jgi:hypothetical protein
VAEGEADSLEDDSDGEAEDDGDDSEVDSVFFVVEDFFGDAEAEASALALVLVLFFVLEAPVPEVLALPDFFVVEVVAAAPVVVFFFDVADVLAVVELAVVSFLFAHAVTNASAARTVIQHRTDFFIS